MSCSTQLQIQYACRYNMNIDANTTEEAQRKVDDYNQALISNNYSTLDLAQKGIGLDIMANSSDVWHRSLAADYCNGDDAILDKLVHDTEDVVTQYVVRYHRPQDAEILMNSDFNLVRAECAKFGGDNVLDYLVNDEDWYVKEEVVKRGRDKDLDKLRYNEDFRIRRDVAKYNRPQDREIFVNDENAGVRAAVADFGRPQDKERFLTKERVPFVRESYVEHCDLNDVRDFLNDPSEQVRNAALKRLNAEH